MLGLSDTNGAKSNPHQSGCKYKITVRRGYKIVYVIKNMGLLDNFDKVRREDTDSSFELAFPPSVIVGALFSNDDDLSFRKG